MEDRGFFILLEYHFFSLDGQIAKFTQSFTEVAERVVGLLAFMGRGRKVVLKKG